MKKKTISSDKPAGNLTRMRDFLPPPGQLAEPTQGIKVTISLSKPTVDFFKRQARIHHGKYQRMIRSLLDSYAMTYSA